MSDALYRLRILHLSDLHERVALEWMDPTRKKLIESEQSERYEVLGPDFLRTLEGIKNKSPIDLVCFTGDLADWGLPQEYSKATNRLREILEACDVPFERFFPVPGNHDIQRTINHEEWNQFRNACVEDSTGLSKWLCGAKKAPRGWESGWPDAVLARSGAYREWLSGAIARPELLPIHSRHGRLGYRVETALAQSVPFPFHIIGLDSAWLSGDKHDAKKLRLTSDQLNFHTTAEDGEHLQGFRLALVHHPLSHLYDQLDIENRLAKRVDLILHGHQHVPLAEDKTDLDGKNTRILAAGCLYEGDEGERYPNGFNLIDAVLNAEGRPLWYDLTFFGWALAGYWFKTPAIYSSAKHGKAQWKTLLGKQYLALHQGKAPKFAVATKPQGHLEETVKKKVKALLAKPALESLSPILNQQIAEYLEEESDTLAGGSPVDLLVDRIPLLDTMQVLHESVAFWREKWAPSSLGGLAKPRRDLLVEMVGWLCLLAVNEQFVETWSFDSPTEGYIDILIPVVREATVEIILSRLKPKSASLRVIQGVELGGKNFIYLDKFHETGPEPLDLAKAIQRELYEMLNAIPNKEIDEQVKERIKEKLEYKDQLGQSHYLWVGAGQFIKSSIVQGALALLKSELSALTIVGQASPADPKVLKVREEALVARLEEFYQMLYSEGEA